MRTLGAECIEFHITKDRTLYGSDQASSTENVDDLVNGIQSEIGVNESEQFNQQAGEALTGLQQALMQSKDTLQSALNGITGQGGGAPEAFGAEMPAEEPAPDMGAGAEMPAPEEEIDVAVTVVAVKEPEKLPVA